MTTTPEVIRIKLNRKKTRIVTQGRWEAAIIPASNIPGTKDRPFAAADIKTLAEVNERFSVIVDDKGRQKVFVEVKQQAFPLPEGEALFARMKKYEFLAWLCCYSVRVGSKKIDLGKAWLEWPSRVARQASILFDDKVIADHFAEKV